MTWDVGLSVLAAVLALGALVIGIAVWRRQRAHDRLHSPVAGTRPEALRLAERVAENGVVTAFVANPTKPDVPELRAAVHRAALALGMPEPLWLETTEDDPGVGQARSAIDRGADVVVAVGGDGTVRAVAESLAGTGVPMGLIPLGTGNLLARNLDLPLGDPLAALQIALTGDDRTIDVGRLRVLRYAQEGKDDVTRAATRDPAVHEDPRDHLFLVIAGLGFDAAMVADAHDQLKARVGWIAYFVAGFRHLHGRRTRMQVGIDGDPPANTRLRSLLIGNCGKLPGGLTLLPDAIIDDGWLDVAAIDTRGGIAGWAQLLGEVVLQGVGVRTELPAKIGRIDHTRARVLHVTVHAGEHVQVDGELLGRAVEVTARVDPGALTVRVAAAAAA